MKIFLKGFIQFSVSFLLIPDIYESQDMRLGDFYSFRKLASIFIEFGAYEIPWLGSKNFEEGLKNYNHPIALTKEEKRTINQVSSLNKEDYCLLFILSFLKHQRILQLFHLQSYVCQTYSTWLQKLCLDNLYQESLHAPID